MERHLGALVHDLPEGIAAADPTQVGVGEAELKRRHGRTYGLGCTNPQRLGHSEPSTHQRHR